MDPSRISELRRSALLYIYENGAGEHDFLLESTSVEEGIGASREEFTKVRNLLVSQRLLSNEGALSEIGLNTEGQAAAEALGPKVLLRESSGVGGVSVGVNYGIMQVAGAGSAQTANQSLDQARISDLLDQIEKEIPSLSLPLAAKNEASGALADLRKAAIQEGSKAGARMIAAGLSDLLRQGGSALWESLPELFKITT